MSTDDRRDVSLQDVRHLITTQFPHWADLPLQRAAQSGWDNRTYRLGDDMKVRLPSASRYAAQVNKENRWLPHLARHLPVPIPAPIAVGAPDDVFPWPWSVQRWLPGDTASPERIADMSRFAGALADVLRALQAVPAESGPVAGAHNFHRGGALAVYDQETRDCIAALHDEIDARAAVSVWETALSTSWTKPPVWVHGDFASGNLLVRNGTLSAVIDFGCCGAGDPACDLAIQWTFLTGDSRLIFRNRVSADPDCWARARGWALWKALLVINNRHNTPDLRESARQVVRDVTDEHRQR